MKEDTEEFDEVNEFLHILRIIWSNDSIVSLFTKFMKFKMQLGFYKK